MIKKLKKLLNEIKTKGFIPTFQKVFQYLIGIRGLKEEIETLHFFLNAYHDPSSLPATSDRELRLLQLCDVQLLRIVTLEAEKIGLSYWLDYGTLLGAIRHKGFIPWDDDMDIAMPRRDYNRALSELKAALLKYDIILEESDHIGIGYNHKNTGIWLDIFAVDCYQSPKSLEESKDELIKRIKRCRIRYYNNVKKSTIENRAKDREKCIGGYQDGSFKILYHQPEFEYLKELIHDENCVFPLGKIEFEGYSFSSPRDVDGYLNIIYGNNYMGFPRKGLLHHDLGRGPLSTWAKRNGYSMEEILEKLKQIADSLENQL